MNPVPILLAAALFLFFCYSLTCTFFAVRMLAPRFHRNWIACIVLPMANTALLAGVLAVRLNFLAGAALCLLASCLLFFLFFDDDVLRVVFSAAAFAFPVFSLTGLVPAAVSLLMGPDATIRAVCNSAGSFYFCLAAAFLLAAGAVLLFFRFFSRERLRLLFQSPKFLTFLFPCVLLLDLYMLVSCWPMFTDFRLIWFYVGYFMSHALMIGIFVVLFSYGVNVGVLQEATLRTEAMEDQLQKQLLHYRSYEKYTNSLRVFRHDYKRMMGTVNCLLDEGRIEEARRLIAQINDEMHANMRIHKQYSNNYLLDAVLQDAANTCEAEGIAFDAQVYLPPGRAFQELALCRIAGNLASNALEACRRCERADRFIRAESKVRDGWLTVTVTNSFSGPLRRSRSGELRTTKPSGQGHGLGLRSVRELTEAAGGVFLAEGDEKAGIFTVRLHVRCGGESVRPAAPPVPESFHF